MAPIKKLNLLLLIVLFTSSLFAQKEIVVDLTQQKAYAIEDGLIALEGYISSGAEGMETPTGVFKITEKKLNHKSNLWPKPHGGASMPYMMRLGTTPIALHLGELPGAPASHGCIRLQDGFAQKLYHWTDIGTKVTVKGDASLFVPSVKTHRHSIRSIVSKELDTDKDNAPMFVEKQNKPMYMEDFSFLRR